MHVLAKGALCLGLLAMTGAGCTSAGASGTTSATNTDSSTSTDMAEWTFPGVLPEDKIESKQVRIVTEKGDIVIKLFADTAPKTVSNFVYLIEGGYYDGLTFHRREEGFVLQGGDPNGNGTGGPGYSFEDELNDDHTYKRGIVAMANRGPDTNGSQFFIMLRDYPLPKSYSIFGEVTEGMEIVDELMKGSVMTKVTVEDAE